MAGKRSASEYYEEDKGESKSRSSKETPEIFVGNLRFSVKEDDLRDFFEKYGEVAAIKMINRDGRYTGKSFVLFKEVEDFEKALEADGKDFQGRPMIVKKSSEKPPRRDQQDSGATGNKVYVGGLSYNSTEDSVKSFFEECGEIKEVKIMTESDGKSRGFGFVEFEQEDSARKATGLTGQELDGRRLRIEIAGGKKSSGRDGFRGGRGRRDRRDNHGHHGDHRDHGYHSGHSGRRPRHE